MRWWLHRVVRRRANELFMLNLLLVTLGLAWLTELAGLSLALGAFIAGMLISETPKPHQVETDIRPFHDVLLGLFFITIGMMLDWHIVLERWAMVLFMLVASSLLKAVVILHSRAHAGRHHRVSCARACTWPRPGVWLCAAVPGAGRGWSTPELLNPILASHGAVHAGHALHHLRSQPMVMKLVANEWMMQSLQMTTIARKSIKPIAMS